MNPDCENQGVKGYTKENKKQEKFRCGKIISVRAKIICQET